jgi:hypothetical protein
MALMSDAPNDTPGVDKTAPGGPVDPPPWPTSPFGGPPVAPTPFPAPPFSAAPYPPPPVWPQPAGPPPGWYQNPNMPYGAVAPQYVPYGYGYATPFPLGTSGLAIASLIVGICGFLCVTPFVGIGLGIGALVQIRKTGQAGKGMAIAGLILSVVWLALIVLSIVFGHNSNSGGPTPSPDSGGTSA